MSRVHLTERGAWVTCRAVNRACPRSIHLTGHTVAEVQALPQDFLAMLIEAVDPPNARPARDIKEWRDPETGELHRSNDLPAVVLADGREEWWWHGQRHRDGDKPAIIDRGLQEWWSRGKRHRGDDLPAIITADGSQLWFHRGRQHRENDLPAEIRPDGTRLWYHNDKLHRDRAPAVIRSNGTTDWYSHGRYISWLGRQTP